MGSRDKARLEAYFDNIRDLELKLASVRTCPTKPAASPAQAGGPLDNTVILVGACRAHPGFHTTHNLPTLVAGGLGFGLNQGQHIALPMNTDIGNLHFTIANAMGFAGSSFNGHASVLPGVFS